ncbi:MAG: alpha/beta fold hydrolase [Candidatus Obscuribacter sp.]|nr:alpha/beta fold hydrolase [Candidatus Obscuribacter sp.]
MPVASATGAYVADITMDSPLVVATSDLALDISRASLEIKCNNVPYRRLPGNGLFNSVQVAVMVKTTSFKTTLLLLALFCVALVLMPCGYCAGDKKQVRRGNAPCLSWFNADMPVKAVFVCVHGLGLHNGTYEALGKRLSTFGYATYAIDVRGFGSWMEAKGRECVDFDGCLSDLKSTLKVVHRAHPGVPVYLLGESIGGAIALRATPLIRIWWMALFRLYLPRIVLSKAKPVSKWHCIICAIQTSPSMWAKMLSGKLPTNRLFELPGVTTH